MDLAASTIARGVNLVCKRVGRPDDRMKQQLQLTDFVLVCHWRIQTQSKKRQLHNELVRAELALKLSWGLILMVARIIKKNWLALVEILSLVKWEAKRRRRRFQFGRSSTNGGGAIKTSLPRQGAARPHSGPQKRLGDK